MRNTFFNHRLGSWCGALFFSFWIGQRIYFNRHWLFEATLSALTWWLITFQFIIFVISYLTRSKAKEHAHGFIETVFPFICAAMPFALIADYPLRPNTVNLVQLQLLSKVLAIGGTLVIIAGIFYLRRSFSIMTEVRDPVFKGIYRYTRHPMYLGSMLTALGALFQNFGWLNGLVFVIFCSCQVYRATREEQKIATALPQYAAYASRVGWIGTLGRRRPQEPKA